MDMIKSLRSGSVNKKPKSKIIVVVSLMVLILFWMASGIFRKNHVTEQESPEAGKKMSYEVKAYSAQLRSVYLKAQGNTLATHRVPVTSAVEGKITQISGTSGTFMEKDEPILEIEKKNKKENLDKAKATLRRANIGYKAALVLYEKGLGSIAALEQAEIGVKEAKSALALAKIDVQDTTVRAPYNGYVDYIKAQVGDMNAKGVVLGYFINSSAITVQVNLSEKEMLLARQAKTARILINDGQYADAVVKFLSKVADKDLPTFLMELEVKNEDAKLFSGQNVEVDVVVGQQMAHKLPQSALMLNNAGVLAVKAVDTNNAVKTYPISVIDEDEEGVYVVGLPQEVKIITVGHGYAMEGETLDNSEMR
ncbi:membrane fusion protein, multidrug efflux system [Alphaproteobacteria bacterium]